MLGLLSVLATAISVLATLGEQKQTSRPGDVVARGSSSSAAGESWDWRIVHSDEPGLGPLAGQVKFPGWGLWDDATTIDSDDELEPLVGRLEAHIASLGPWVEPA